MFIQYIKIFMVSSLKFLWSRLCFSITILIIIRLSIVDLFFFRAVCIINIFAFYFFFVLLCFRFFPFHFKVFLPLHKFFRLCSSEISFFDFPVSLLYFLLCIMTLLMFSSFALKCSSLLLFC